ncbi:hypothetical protein [Selenomonas noxia]|jgi:hypothetical protein|uniref:hypothetical protein n=1 Tax=Selenomonas noxia TaxID=135083 RepID=UPI0023590EF2|nr:hypothetical protein [Selenomonas noxia]
MLYIQKNPPPGTFIQYQKTNGACFDGMDTNVKNALRTALLTEQGYLCAYCMTPLENAPDKVKIEHYVSRDSENELVYKNLLAVCYGGEGKPPREQTCDTHKGNIVLSVDPQNKAHIEQIRYEMSGAVLSQNKPIMADLDNVLNLNCPRLIAARKKVLMALFAVMKRDKQDKSAVKGYLEKKLRTCQERKKGRASPYCGILLWYLQRRIRQCG